MPTFPEWTKMDYELSGPLAGIESARRDQSLRERMALENLFQQAQTRGQDLTNQGLEAKLPYLADEARLGNLKAQQGIDLQLPQQGLAKQQAANPSFMQGMFNNAQAEQQGKLGQQELKNRVTHYDQLIDAYKTNKLPGFIETAQRLGIPFDQLQPHFGKDGDPIPSMMARRTDLVNQLSITPDSQAAERKQKQDNLVKLEIAQIAAEASKYGRRPGGGSNPKPLSSDQAYTELQLKAIRGEELTPVETWAMENFIRLKAAGKQFGATIGEDGVVQQSSVPMSIPPQPGKAAPGSFAAGANPGKRVTQNKDGSYTITDR